MYARKRDYGHEVLAGRKERRRFSLLGMRKFMGDYLDVGGSSAQGEMLHNAAGISRECAVHRFVLIDLASEAIHFSSRAELLVSKLGRSSKLSPRFLIIVSARRGSHSLTVTDGQSCLFRHLGRKGRTGHDEYGEEGPSGDDPRYLDDEPARRLCGTSQCSWTT